MQAYRATLVWTLRLLAVITFVTAIIQIASALFVRPMIGDQAVVLSLFLSMAWAALVALALAELVADQTTMHIPRLWSGLIWIMRGVALAHGLYVLPTLIHTLSSQAQYGTEAQILGYTLASLLLQPVTLLAFAECLSQAKQRLQPHGNAT